MLRTTGRTDTLSLHGKHPARQNGLPGLNAMTRQCLAAAMAPASEFTLTKEEMTKPVARKLMAPSKRKNVNWIMHASQGNSPKLWQNSKMNSPKRSSCELVDCFDQK